ncbi:flavohemoglobin expression-modulating QEGLA motif protein [Luteimonas qiangzhengi]|uniref:flavohemoglobin expression-modulating QEGLA motif protein n=1 Tax=Luteimonas sp. MJ146 TaxID=3129240 RepID=UPI0031B9D33F
MSSPGLNRADTTRPLPPIAAEVDNVLAAIDAELDWLLALTPLGTDALWEGFEAADRTSVPPLRYAEPILDLETMRKRLGELPVEKIESPLLAGVLREKQRELERMIELVRLRGTDGFVTASIDLFGGVEAGLLELAEQILADVGPSERLTADCGVDTVVSAVEDEVAWYRERAPDFTLEITVDADVGSLMMVSHGRLYLDADMRLPSARVQPLVQHEIGTHIVTRYNGLRQPMRQLAVGLANYDPLQEGLGVLAEYLTGYLPGERLRVLAARVVAANMAIHGEDIPAVFARLHDTHGFATDDAFDIAVRALRGGGLTKDAVYLRGLCDLLDHLRAGGEFEPLFRGKFALSHLVVLDQLAEAGWAEPPALLPRYACAADFNQTLDRCRNVPVQRLFQSHPTPPRELCA